MVLWQFARYAIDPCGSFAAQDRSDNGIFTNIVKLVPVKGMTLKIEKYFKIQTLVKNKTFCGEI